MSRLIIFVFVLSAIIVLFGSRIIKWAKSIGLFLDRKENQTWQKFDKKLNPRAKK